MALFNDGPLGTSVELQEYENGILDVASTEKINLTAKATLAQREIATELLLFLDRNSLWDPRLLIRQIIGISDIVITEPLKRWHAYKTLAMAYQDAYNNQLNDRYQGKWTQYNQLSSAAGQTLFEVGVGIVHQPMPRASEPSLTTVPMGVTGSSYYVSVSWLSASSQEGLASVPVQVTSADGSAVAVGVSNPPQGAVLWNVYAGNGPDNIALQSTSPLTISATWILPTTGLRAGRAPGDGQTPEWWIVDRRILLRG
jgi:hypothetical protein